MKHIFVLAALLATFCSQAQDTKPKLVIGIVVDQMKQEYLYRFEDKLSPGGFKRIIEDGFVSKNTHYNYIPTKTAAGHASIYTGTTPRYHGVISNSWYSKVLGRKVYCVSDTTVKGVGIKGFSGSMSPKNLQSTTITDELKLTTNFRSKVIGVSIKDRGAVLPAGHVADGAYWYNSKTGDFATSTFYKSELPKWVVKFNGQKLVDKYLNQQWTTSLPLDQYTESTPDITAYEGGFKGKDAPSFPYNLEELRAKNGPYGMISSTPFGNSLVLDFAKKAIESEDMGKDAITDFLAVSLSSTDYVGHNFAPNSVELEDTYLKLDADLASFLSFLDEKVGKGNYTVFITADHAVVANPKFLTDNQLPGGFASPDSLKSILKDGLNKKFGEGDWIRNISNEQVFLNHQLVEQSEMELSEVQEVVESLLYHLEEIGEVYKSTDLKSIASNDHLGTLLSNGFNKKLSGDVLFTLKSGYLFNEYGTTGTSHGSGYTYDTHVPLLFYGKNIKKGSTTRYVSINDIAPTLSMLLNISLPSACTGNPLTELFE
jgi:predicted AlkP superfamily pyrophosphatase or phosphodiesterase